MKGFINAVQHRMSGSAMKSLNITDVHGDVVKNLKDTISKRLKGFNQVTNILVGLVVTLPVTCHALNWVYPRFMNVFFPNLANSKKSDAPEENGKKVDGGTKK